VKAFFEIVRFPTMDYIRDSQLGHLIRAVTKNKTLQWPDELPGFQYPILESSTLEKLDIKESLDDSSPEVEQDHTIRTRNENTNEDQLEDQLQLERVATLVGAPRMETETNLSKLGTNAADVILVDWYSEDDVENPLNWTTRKKLFTTMVILYALNR
jgi:DHA1 family multidrug resistance protein-like MFS transporter